MKTNNNFFNQRLIYPIPIDGRTTNWIGGYLKKDDKQYIVFGKLIENKNEVRHNNLITINDWIEIIDKIERIHLIKKLFTDNIKRNELIELYKENHDNELLKANSIAHYYTDRSARKLGNFIQLAMAWIRIENNDNNAIINQFKAANFSWPSSTKMELMAIYTAVVVTEKNKEIIVYTDSLSAINQIDSYKKELSNRRKMKLHHHIILEAIFQIIKQFNLKLTLVKVKAHDGIWGNELADKLAKEALTEDRILTKDFRNENSYRLSWYSIKVEQNNRSFIKLINKVNKEIDEKKLKRMSNQHIDYDKKLLYRILNLDNEKINHTQNN